MFPENHSQIHYTWTLSGLPGTGTIKTTSLVPLQPLWNFANAISPRHQWGPLHSNGTVKIRRICFQKGQSCQLSYNCCCHQLTNRRRVATSPRRHTSRTQMQIKHANLNDRRVQARAAFFHMENSTFKGYPFNDTIVHLHQNLWFKGLHTSQDVWSSAHICSLILTSLGFIWP